MRQVEQVFDDRNGVVKRDGPVDDEFSALIQDEDQGEGEPYQFDFVAQDGLSGRRTSAQRTQTVG